MAGEGLTAIAVFSGLREIFISYGAASGLEQEGFDVTGYFLAEIVKVGIRLRERGNHFLFKHFSLTAPGDVLAVMVGSYLVTFSYWICRAGFLTQLPLWPVLLCSTVGRRFCSRFLRKGAGWIHLT